LEVKLLAQAGINHHHGKFISITTHEMNRISRRKKTSWRYGDLQNLYTYRKRLRFFLLDGFASHSPPKNKRIHKRVLWERDDNVILLAIVREDTAQPVPFAGTRFYVE
jgi:hypothetical protein